MVIEPFRYPKSRLILLFLCLLMLFHPALLGQVIIQGQIADPSGNAIPRINILLYEKVSDVVLAYAISDEEGRFTVKLNSGTDSLRIKVSSVNYNDVVRIISNQSQSLKYTLTEEIKDIEGVTVMASPIQKWGDTLSYLVQSFTRPEDRSIEDVLKRMPGIAVESSGQILYQGMPINRFYVEGLDLMEGRYSVVSKNLPKTAVTAVEILENHQPLRMLEGKVESRQAALNLKIKRGVTTTGTALLGTGFKPFLRDVNLTPMIFTKEFQFLTSFQTNNTGNNISRQMEVYTQEDIGSYDERPNGKVEFLNVIPENPEEISTDRYLNNNDYLLNINGLKQIGKNLNLRSNVFYTSGNQQSTTNVLRSF